MTKKTDLERLSGEITEAFILGVEEFEISTYVDEGLHRAIEISRHFRQRGYHTQIYGKRDVDREAEFATHYSVIVRKKKVD